MPAYYNEFDPFAAQWLRELIKANLIAPGDVDERSITEVKPDDLKGYTQCHFFAGIGGWSYALRLALWPDDRPVWTGSCPCQPFSAAGSKSRQSDERHLWPYFARLIGESKPPALFGEQVASAVAAGWWDDVASDLEKENYSCAATVLPASSVGAPHRRERLWFVAYSESERRGKTWYDSKRPKERASCGGNVGDTKSDDEGWLPFRIEQEEPRFECSGKVMADSSGKRPSRSRKSKQPECYTQKENREAAILEPSGGFGIWSTEPDVGRVAHGVSNRVGKLRGYGNAIVPQVAAEFIKAAM